MKKGIVLEIDNRYVTLLTPDGQFLRAHKQANEYQIGQEIIFFPIEEGMSRKTITTHLFRWMTGRVALGAMVMIILGASTLIPFYQRNQVYAYMTIDNQSSVELAVNKQLEVIELLPTNKKGEILLDNLDNWKNEELVDVSKNILKEMDAQGFNAQEEIVLNTVYMGKRNEKTDSHMQQEITELKGYVATKDKSIKLVKGTIEERNEARQRGMSIGEYKKETKQKEEKKTEENSRSTGKKPQKGEKPVPSESLNNQKQTEIPKNQVPKENGKPSKINDRPTQQNEQKKQDNNPSEKQMQKLTTDKQVSKQSKKNRERK